MDAVKEAPPKDDEIPPMEDGIGRRTTTAWHTKHKCVDTGAVGASEIAIYQIAIESQFPSAEEKKTFLWERKVKIPDESDSPGQEVRSSRSCFTQLAFSLFSSATNLEKGSHNFISDAAVGS